MNLLLERLAGVAARKRWMFIIGWLIVLGGLLGAKHAWGGEYVNNYTISGSDSATGLNVLNSTFPQQGGYGGQVVFHAKTGSVTAWQSQVNESVSNVSKLPDVIRAVSPFASSSTGAVSKDGTIAYANVGWNVNPNSLDASYLDKLNNAVAPAMNAGLQVEYGRSRRDRAADAGPDVRGHRPVVCARAAADHVRLADRGGHPAGCGGLQRALRTRAAWAARPGGHVPDHCADHRDAARARGRRGLWAFSGGQAPGATGQRDGGLALSPARRGHIRRGDRGGWRHRRHFSPWPVHLGGRLRRVAGPGRRDRRGCHDDLGADPGARIHGGGPAGRAGTDCPGPCAEDRSDRTGTGGADRSGHAAAA